MSLCKKFKTVIGKSICHLKLKWSLEDLIQLQCQYKEKGLTQTCSELR